MLRCTFSQSSILAINEDVVAPAFDESGLKFHLLYNKIHKFLYWVLDITSQNIENFYDIGHSLFLGNRTGFVFHRDESGRMVLIAVKKENVLKNNWFDGPFDQMPDQYISQGKVRIKYYFENNTKKLSGPIDEYGFYVQRPQVRASVLNYYLYDDVQDVISVFLSCSRKRQKFLAACVTAVN